MRVVYIQIYTYTIYASHTHTQMLAHNINTTQCTYILTYGTYTNIHIPTHTLTHIHIHTCAHRYEMLS